MESRRRIQTFFHGYDRYANPVTLTYNQKKKFTTTIGGICTMISFVAIVYYVTVIILMHTVFLTYNTQLESVSLNDKTDNPESFNVTTDDV